MLLIRPIDQYRGVKSINFIELKIFLGRSGALMTQSVGLRILRLLITYLY